MASFSYQYFGASDVGLVRSENQDAFLVHQEKHLFAVADGIGGLPGGRKASNLALQTLQKVMTEKPLLDFAEACTEAHRAVLRLGRIISPKYGIGTTLTALQLRDHQLHFVHAGDSVLFRHRSGVLDMLTVEHAYERIKILNGPSATAPALSSFLGHPTDFICQSEIITWQSGDRYLLATDGITKVIPDDDLAAIFEAQNDPENLTNGLITMARLRGGWDNATALAIFFQ